MGAFIQYREGTGFKNLRFDAVVSETSVNEAQITEHPVEGDADIADHIITKLDTFTMEVFIGNSLISAHPGTGGSDGFLPLDSEPVEISVSNSPISVPYMVLDDSTQTFSPPKPPLKIKPADPLGTVIGAISSLLPGDVALQLTEQSLQSNDFTIKGFERVNNDNRVRVYDEAFRDLKDNKTLVKVITSTRTLPSMVLIRHTLRRTKAEGDGGIFSLEFREIRVVSSKKVKAPVPTEPRAKTQINKGPTTGTEAPLPKKSAAAHLADGQTRKDRAAAFARGQH